MNDAASAFLKVLSALTSPKAAIKYICVAVFVLFSWNFVSAKVIDAGGPEQYVELISLFLGLGLGAFIGECIYFILNLGWVYAGERIKSIAHNRKVQNERNVELLKQRDKEILYVQNFIKAYANFSASKVKILEDLLSEEVELGNWSDEVYFLRTAGYIQMVVDVTQDSSLYKLNPLLIDILKSKKRRAV